MQVTIMDHAIAYYATSNFIIPSGFVSFGGFFSIQFQHCLRAMLWIRIRFLRMRIHALELTAIIKVEDKFMKIIWYVAKFRIYYAKYFWRVVTNVIFGAFYFLFLEIFNGIRNVKKKDVHKIVLGTLFDPCRLAYLAYTSNDWASPP